MASRAPLPFAWGVLYAKPNPDGSRKLCQNCFMWSWQDRRCSIHAPDLEVPAAAVCGYHVFGDPAPARPEIPNLDPVDPKLSGFIVTQIGTSCDICVYYEPTSATKGLCHGVAKKDGKPPQPVQALGCCARWEPAEA